MKTLIIGGNSFVGKNFTKTFTESPLISSRDKSTRLYLDLENVNSSFFEEIKKEEVEYCFFLAAISSPDDCQEKYENAKLINYISTKKVINELLKMSAKVLKESKFPTFTTGSIRSLSIIAICLANVDSAKTSPLLGPV